MLKEKVWQKQQEQKECAIYDMLYVCCKGKPRDLFFMSHFEVINDDDFVVNDVEKELELTTDGSLSKTRKSHTTFGATWCRHEVVRLLGAVLQNTLLDAITNC